jgi:polysaccharide export outer membrane protein
VGNKAWINVILLFCLVAIPCLAVDAAAQAEEEGISYRIGPGDVLDISDWKNPDLTKMVTVLPDGSISFPLIGEVKAEGKTVSELKKELEKLITRYVPDPVLSVIVHQVNNLQIYIIGKVQRPGTFQLSRDINVLQALSMAGGLNPFAKPDNIKIFREINHKSVIIPFNYDDVVEENKLEGNIRLLGGDVIVVP